LKVQKLFKFCQLTKKVELKTKKVFGASWTIAWVFFSKEKILVHSEFRIQNAMIDHENLVFFFQTKCCFFVWKRKKKD